MPADSTGRSNEIKDELRTAIETRRDLGPDYEPAIVDAFLERIDARLEARVDELAAKHKSSGAGSEQLWLGLGSLIAAIPLSGIASQSGALALVAVWTMIAVINVTFAISRHER
jgi:hypothetical protein